MSISIDAGSQITNVSLVGINLTSKVANIRSISYIFNDPKNKVIKLLDKRNSKLKYKKVLMI